MKKMKNRTVGTLTYTAGGLCILFFWLLFGDFAIAMRDRAGMPSVMELLRQHHASDTTMSVLFSALPAIIGMVLGPMVSYKSDRYRSRWGRRIPFLIIPTPIGALAMIGIGCSPWLGAQLNGLLGSGSPGLDFCVLTIFCPFWIIFECVLIVTIAIFTGLINDVVPHGLLGRFYGCFRIISLGAGIIFNYWIFKFTETHLFEIFLCVGLLFGGGFALMCSMVKEGDYPPSPVEEAAGTRGNRFLSTVKIYFVECFSHSYYLWIFAALTLGVMSLYPFNMFAQWYADSLGMPKAVLGKLTALSYTISIILAFVVGWLVDRYSALRVGIITMLIFSLTMLLSFVFIGGRTSFGVIYVFHTVISGIYFTATASLPMVLFPKIRFAQFASAGTLLVSITTALIGLIQGPLLDISGHNYRLTLLIACIFSILALMCFVVVMRNYKALKTGEAPLY
jgi:MFS family permease